MNETLRERLERKKGATKPSWQTGKPQPLIEGTPLEKKAGAKT